MRRRLRAVTVVVAALCVGRCREVLAQGPSAAGRPATPGQARRNVELSIVGAVDAELEDTVRELLGRLGIRLVAAAAQGTDEELARVEIDLDPSSDARVLVVDARTGGVVLRRRVPRNVSASIFREEIAHAVDEAIQSELLVDQDRVAATPSAQPGISPSPTPAPTAADAATPEGVPPAARAEPAPLPPQPAATPPPVAPELVVADTSPAPTRRRLGLAMDVTTLAGAGPFAQSSYAVARIAGGVVVASRRWLRPSIGLSVAYLLPFGPSSPGLDYHANVLSVRAMPGIEVLHTSRFALGVGAGGGVDVLTVVPGAGAMLSQTTLRPSTTRPDPVLSLAVTGHVAIAQGVAFTATALCDFDLVNRKYVEDDGATQVDVFVPWRVRPMLLAGFTFTALGEGLFAAKGGR